MARVVLIVDSATGTMIDAAGRGREGARYRKLAKRMLSLGTPTAVLDYGGNGASKLEVSDGGDAGEEINLKASSVNILTSDPSSPAVLKVNGKTLEEIISSQAGGDALLDKIVGKEGEISVDLIQDPEHESDPSYQVLQISLDQSIEGKMETVEQALEDFSDEGFIRKADLERAIRNISFEENYTLEDVKGMLMALMQKLHALVGDGQEEEIQENNEETT